MKKPPSQTSSKTRTKQPAPAAHRYLARIVDVLAVTNQCLLLHAPKLKCTCMLVESLLQRAAPADKLIETLLTHDQAGLLVNLEQHEQESEQPDRSKQLLQQIRL